MGVCIREAVKLYNPVEVAKCLASFTFSKMSSGSGGVFDGSVVGLMLDLPVPTKDQLSAESSCSSPSQIMSELLLRSHDQCQFVLRL